MQSAAAVLTGITDPFAQLNPSQCQAVEHGIGDPGAPALLVIAGAGSGKTLTLASRVARLVLAGADPQRVLLLTFSRRAALEMERRAGHMLHQSLRLGATSRAPSLPWAGTFHAIGARLLREHAGRIGLHPQFTILDRADAEDLIGIVRQEQGLTSTHKRFPLKGTCLAIYSRVLNSAGGLPAVLQDQFPWCGAWEHELKALFRAYVAAKQDQHVLDYDDLLLYWARMMEDATLAREIGARFDHVLVDEYQDTNRLQAGILKALKPAGDGLTVVGDDAQSIYGFRAAEVRNILDFPAQFASTARVVSLERNYRSTQPILDACNALMELAPERYAKRLWTERTTGPRPQLVSVEDELMQARWVADQVLAHREGGLALKSQAVLFRSASHSAAVELELIRRNIPFVKFGGLKFLEAAHIKDLLSLLRWVENPRSRMAGFRVAQLVQGIGPASARRLLDAMDGSPDPRQALLDFKPPAAAVRAWGAFRETWLALCKDPSPWPQELDLALRWYQPQLERLHEDAKVRLADLAQLVRIASGHASRERFLTELTLDPPDATSDAGPPFLDEDYLILSTIHSAKGQEWASVHVLNVVDGCIPSDLGTGNAAQIEEERRLLYVAMTRAREHLHLLVPQRFYVHQQDSRGDRHVYGSLTRFIPEGVARHFEAVGPLTPVEETGHRPHGAPLVVDLGTKVRSMWD